MAITFLRFIASKCVHLVLGSIVRLYRYPKSMRMVPLAVYRKRKSGQAQKNIEAVSFYDSYFLPIKTAKTATQAKLSSSSSSSQIK